MPHAHRRNRVTPFGTLEAVPHRGLFMGNRGNLKRADGTLRPWRGRTWICCAVAFRGRRVPLDDPRRYTPLFFLDEAMAFAAGHRPCAECRHRAYQDFRHAFPGAAPLPATDMDRVLHAARIDGTARRTFPARRDTLPAGTFVTLPDNPGQALLVRDGALHPWSHAGYGPPVAARPGAEVRVLTPAPMVDVLRAGYAPRIAPCPP